MRSPKVPYTIVGVSLDRRELANLQHECQRSERERSEVIKHALKYYLMLDVATKDKAIIQD
jgi:metal-responsive CopG/Arc/MetJ family transcriptional regulator